MKIPLIVACALLVLSGIILNLDVFAEGASELMDGTTGWILETTSFFEVEVEHITKDHNEHPELYSMNSEGFRGSEFTKNKPDDTYRIIAVGGSTTFGSGVTNENTWPRILEKKLQNISEGKNVEVINAGIPQAYSFTESILIKEKILSHNPDMLIIYDGWNDLQHDYELYSEGTDPILGDKIVRFIGKSDYVTPKVLLSYYFNLKYDSTNIIKFDYKDIDKKIVLWKKLI